MNIVKCPKCGTSAKTNKDSVRCPVCSRTIVVPKPVVKPVVKKARFFEDDSPD